MTARPDGIGPRTRAFGLVGRPVAHSLSPAMHNAAFLALGMDAVYLAFDVPAEALGAALEGARALGFGGLNVTVPHKEQALALAACAAPSARLTGAANTLVPADAGWEAHNTDVEGFAGALAEDLGFDPRGRRCWILGAGGAARAAVAALARARPQEILVMNRNRKRAERLAAAMGPAVGVPLRAVEADRFTAQAQPGDLVVSATPLGLEPDTRWPWDLAEIPPGLFVFDMAYRAGGETSLVLQARAAGHRAVSGRSMLLRQGAAAFALWTGRPPPVEIMRQALERAPGP